MNKKLMNMINFTPLWCPADEGGAGGDGGQGESGGDGGQGEGGGAGEGGGDQKLWWEGETYTTSKDWMGKKDLLKEDQGEVLAKSIEGWRNAEARLGKPAESLMDRPAEGQTTAEWMRANAETFGLPDKPEGYELPEIEMPDGMKLNSTMVEESQKIAFEEGITPTALARLQEVVSKDMLRLFTSDVEEEKKANDEMRANLQKDWGDQTDAKIGQAQTAFQALAEAAGMDADEQLAAASALSKNNGDPMVMKMFASLAGLMGEDTLKGLGSGAGLTTTPAEAKAKKAQLMAPDGPWNKAMKAGDKAKQAEIGQEIKRMNKIIANV